tara:strand:+ start:192 stop:1148 length:957 start_codon:yes stop_codon:yes gene_type:complete
MSNSLDSSKNKILSTFGKDLHDTVFGDEDLNIKSFPQTQMSNPRNVKLEYGGKDSIISTFQSDIELAFLLQSLLKTAATNQLLDNYSFLLNKEALLSITSRTESAMKDTGHKNSSRKDLGAFSTHANSVKSVDTAKLPWASIEDTLSLIANLSRYVNDTEIKSILEPLEQKDQDAFMRLQKRLEITETYRELLGMEDTNSSYFTSQGTRYDRVNGTSLVGRLIANHLRNGKQITNAGFKIRVQTLGIPELDEKFNIGQGYTHHSRRFYFKAHDISREKYSNEEELHWLTGQYKLTSLSHTITPARGYVTEMELTRSAY